MTSKKRLLFQAAATAVVALSLTACGGATDNGSDLDAAAGDPVSGGTLRVLEVASPRGLDPARSSIADTPITFSALFGELLVPDPEKDEYVCGFCESFATEDGGSTWDLVMREGLTFTDGTAFDAEAVKFNWERLKDPALGGSSARTAGSVDRIEVIDARTAKIHLVEPNPSFPEILTVRAGAMNYIASPSALAEGADAFNQNPVGAGPFVLESWVPNGALKLTRNPDYYDAPRPYLDALEIQATPDVTQRFNGLLAGNADFMVVQEEWFRTEAEAAGFVMSNDDLDGANGLILQTTHAPFDDIRAREAVLSALDFEALSDGVTLGYPSTPRTLFNEDSPLYVDVPLTTFDPEKAQKLFDELADEGKPVEFSFLMIAGSVPAQALYDSMLGQLAEFDNVTVTQNAVEPAELGGRMLGGDFDMTITSLSFRSPDSVLYPNLHTSGTSNLSGISDPELDEALDAARAATDTEGKKEQYEKLQKRLAELAIFGGTHRYGPGSVRATNVHGITQFGYSTSSAATLWIEP